MKMFLRHRRSIKKKILKHLVKNHGAITKATVFFIIKTFFFRLNFFFGF